MVIAPVTVKPVVLIVVPLVLDCVHLLNAYEYCAVAVVAVAVTFVPLTESMFALEPTLIVEP